MAESKFDLDSAVKGLSELDKLRKSLESIQETSDKVNKQKSFGDYLSAGFKNNAELVFFSSVDELKNECPISWASVPLVSNPGVK